MWNDVCERKWGVGEGTGTTGAVGGSDRGVTFGMTRGEPKCWDS